MKPFDLELAKQGNLCVTDTGWMFESFVMT